MEQDVAAYYNQTQNHYQRWWQLAKGMALHYGIWDDDTGSFLEALNNTNKYLAELVGITIGQRVLDAGCGVGGSAIFLAKNHKVQVTGITLSELQAETANKNALFHQVDQLVEFKVLDFCDTKLYNDSFDIIWACESSSSATDKQQMAAEWFRLLKPGGKIVLSDFFKTSDTQDDKDQLLDKWAATWAMSPLVTNGYLTRQLEVAGFEIKQTNDLTNNISKTAKRMYLTYWLGLIPSKLYNTIFGASTYARNHYKSGLYQYNSLKQGLWQYNSILAIKPEVNGTIIDI
jgi:cyclopropane fatty-acyl-phospholipid synthase-like methyltransferase